MEHLYKNNESHFCLIGTLIRPVSFCCHCNQIGGEWEASTPLYLSQDYKISFFFSMQRGKKTEKKNPHYLINVAREQYYLGLGESVAS